MKTKELTSKLIPTAMLILLAVIALTVSSCNSNKGFENQKPKYIFLFIGDGMGSTNVSMAESYMSYKAGKIGGEQLTFTEFPVLGAADTYSANKHITCSSAAGTAISCGVKTNNKYLGVDTEGNPVENISEKLKKDGYKIGILTSVPINHATPAVFYAHNKNRNDYYNISTTIPQTGFEFFGGNGFLQYYGKKGDKKAITEYLEENGSKVCFGKEEFEANKNSARQMVFCQPGSKDKNASDYSSEADNTDCTLAEMTEMCLEFLGNGKEPFFIMCEGGEIDWRAHANDTYGMIKDILEFNDAVKIAYEFYNKYPEETLIVVTADHETGGATLGGSDDSKRGSSIKWELIEEAKEKELSEEENRILNDDANIGWATKGHAGGPVPVYAIGKGAEKFAGRIDNTDISKYILGK